MDQTNPSEAAAASSPLPDERTLQHIAESRLGYYPEPVQAMAAEILRMRRDCPPTAEVEQMRADLKRLRDEKKSEIATAIEHLRKAGVIVGSPMAGPTPGVKIGETMTLASTIGMLCDERAKILAGLGREAKSLLEASFMLRCATGRQPMPSPRVEETFGIFEALRKLCDERDTAMHEADAWKRKTDTFGADLNRIRSLVPTASDEQTTFEVIRDELRRLMKRAQEAEAIGERNGKAATERIDLLAAAAQTLGCKPQDVPLECARLHRMLVAFMEAGNLSFGGDVEAQMLALANEVAGLCSSGFREACMAFDGFLRRCGINVSKLEGLMPVQWVIAAAKLLQKGAAAYEPALPAEAQTAIAAMRDVGPELAKAGIQVGPRCSHAEAVALLRGERDQWREKFEMADREAANAARWGISTGERLTAAGFALRAPKEAGLHGAVLEALAELTRLRKESKRDQVGRQQALLDEIARLLPGKGPLLERVRHAAKVASDDAIAESIMADLGIDDEAREAMRQMIDGAFRARCKVSLSDVPKLAQSLLERRSLPAKEGPLPGSFCGTNQPEMPPLKADAPCGYKPASHRDDFDNAPNFGGKFAPATGQPRAGGVVAAGTIPGASPFPPFHHGGKVGSATETVDALCGNEPSAHKQEFTAFGESLRGCAAPKVGPATGQPRTEAPLAADGSGTVVELGEAFREAMRWASEKTKSITGAPTEARLRYLHTAVAELAKVVERIGAR